MIHNYLTQEGSVQSLADPCMYVKTTEIGLVMALVWVDDIIIAGSNTDVLKEVKKIDSKFRETTMFITVFFACQPKTFLTKLYTLWAYKWHFAVHL